VSSSLNPDPRFGLKREPVRASGDIEMDKSFQATMLTRIIIN
jgi:hypothetical protein